MDINQQSPREILDYETSCRPTLVHVANPSAISNGDHLHWKHVGSWRDGIVIDVTTTDDQGVGQITFIRYSYTFPRFVVKDEVWEINFDKDKVYRFEYNEYAHPSQIVTERARACIGQTGYNALRNNNDDFCRWCKAGKHTYELENEFTSSPGMTMGPMTDENTQFVYIGSLEDLKPGHHISWSPLASDQPDNGIDSDGWYHGIVIDIDQTGSEVLCCSDAGLSMSSISFDDETFMDYKFRRTIYQKCHKPWVVLERTGYCHRDPFVPKASKWFAQWAKTGMPEDCDAVETVLIEPTQATTEETEPDASYSMGREFGKGGARSAATSVARGIEGAISAGAKTAATQSSKAIVRGAAEGAAAVAAVGVEAAFLAVDVGLTYRYFNRHEISKDELQKRNIQNTTRSIGAAGASIGGGVAGAAIGSLVFPGVGTVVGGIIGGIAGGITGQVGGHFAGKGIAFAAERPYDALFVEESVVQNQTELQQENGQVDAD